MPLINLHERPRLRSALLTGVAGVDALLHSRATDLARPRVQFLILHEISAGGQDPFRRMLDHLAKHHKFLSYSEAVDRIIRGRIDAPYLSISFDDGLNNNVLAGRVLRERGISACFFVCPSIIDRTDPEAVERFCREQLRDREATGVMNWDEVGQLVQDGHEIGGHTLTHVNLAAASGALLAEETAGCFESLQRRVGSAAHFCWPYGRFHHMTPESVRAVFDAGFTTCASAERGCHSVKAGNARELCLRRDQVEQYWPLKHVDWFLARNSRRSGPATNVWPAEWLAASSLAEIV